MVKKLLTRTEFAKLAGVTAAAVTKAADNALKHCLDGKLVDAGHADALAYMEKVARAKTPETLPGIDPLYDEAVELCRQHGRWSANHIKMHLGVGSTRSARIYRQIEASGLIKNKTVGETPTRDDKVPATVKEPHVRGTAAAKQKRMDEDRGEAEPEIPPNIEIYADYTLREIYEKFGTLPRFKDWLGAMKDISAIQEKQLKAEQVKGNLVHRDIVHRFITDPINAAHMKLLRDGSQTISVRASAMCEAGASQIEIKKLVEDTISSFIKPVKSQVSRALNNLKTGYVPDEDPENVR